MPLVKRLKCPSHNRVYLASRFGHSAQIQPYGWTSDTIGTLKEYGVKVFGYDPLVDDVKNEFGIEVIDDIKNVKNIDCVILTVAHDVSREITLDELKKIMNDNPIIVDVRGMFDQEEVLEKGFYYRSL